MGLLGDLKILLHILRLPSKLNDSMTNQNHSQLRFGLGGPQRPKAARELRQKGGSTANSTRSRKHSNDQQQKTPPQSIQIPENVSLRITRLYVQGRINRQKRREEEGEESRKYVYSDTVRNAPPPSYGECVELGLFKTQPSDFF